MDIGYNKPYASYIATCISYDLLTFKKILILLFIIKSLKNA